MIAGVKLFLGKGLYSVGEAALYARVKRPMMYRWLFGGSKGSRVVTPEIETNEKLVSFLDFVQTLAIRAIRIRKRIPLQKIREAMRFAANEWDMQYPFAMEHTTYLWGDGIVIVPPGEEGQYVETTGKHKGQRLLGKIVELYLEDLVFDPTTKLAGAYTAFRWNGTTIKMDPHRRFGEPLLPSGYTARTIWDAVDVEGGIEQASEAFGIPTEEVQVAMRFFDHLCGNAA